MVSVGCTGTTSGLGRSGPSSRTCALDMQVAPTTSPNSPQQYRVGVQRCRPTRNVLRWGCVESVWVHVNVGRSPWLLRMDTEREFVELCALSCRVSGIAAG